MSTGNGVELVGARTGFIAFCTLAIGFSVAAVAEPENSSAAADDNVRSSISRHHVTGGRDNPTDVRETVEDHKALVTGTSRTRASTRGGQSKPTFGAAESPSVNPDFWVFDVDVVLFNDDDGDGYFHGIDLLFDVDTNFVAADVYAVLYLSLEGGPWNEYAETDDFTIFGATADDDYVLVSELMSGYPTGSYDLLIEVFDAIDGAFLTSFGPADTSELSLLPLEDFDRDAPLEEVVVVVTESGGGGAVDAWLAGTLFLLLIASAIGKIWRRRNYEVLRIDAPANSWQENKRLSS